jgi:hypothetical protein
MGQRRHPGRWVALIGTLIGKWFLDYDEMAYIADTFVTASLVLIPVTATASYVRSDLLVLLDSTSARDRCSRKLSSPMCAFVKAREGANQRNESFLCAKRQRSTEL